MSSVQPAARKPRFIAMSFGFTAALLLGVIVLAATGGTAEAASYSITSTGGPIKDWNTPTTWTPNGVPGSAPGDTVNITTANAQVQLTTGLANPLAAFSISGTNILVEVAGGNLNLGGASSVSTGATLRVNSGGTILVNATALTIGSGGVLDGQGGTINGGGSGSITVNTGGQLSVGGPTTFTNGLNVINAGGSVNVNAALAINATSYITNNSGTINLTSASGVTSDNASTKIDIVGGTLNGQGSGDVPLGIQVNTGSTGTVALSFGDLSLNGGGTHQGSLQATTPGSRINLAGATSTLGGTWSAGVGSAIAITGGTLTVSGTTNFANLILEGGTVTGIGALTGTGSFTWKGGAISGGGGTLTANSITINGALGAMSLQNFKVSANSAINYTGTGVGGLTIGNGGELENGLGATFSYAGGTQPIFVNGTGTLRNQSTSFFNLQDDAPINGTGTFVNSGQFDKQGGAGITTVNTIFNNGGSVLNSVGGAAIAFAGGGAHIGSFSPGTGSKIAFSGGTHAFGTGTSFSGLGTIVVSGGVFDMDVATSINAPTGFTQEGGVVTGAGNFTIGGPFTWAGGTMDASSGVGQTILGGSTSTITGTAATMTLSARTLVNNGTLAYSPAGANYLSIDFGGKLENNGTFTITGDFPINSNNSGTPKVRHLAGTMTKSGGIGTASINPVFEVASTLNINSGSVAVFNGGLSSAAINVPSTGNELILSGGTFQMNAGSSVTGTGAVSVNNAAATLTLGTPLTIGNVKLINGTISGANLTISASLLWQGGKFLGPGTTTVNGGIVTNATAPTTAMAIDNRTFDNNGTFNYTPNPVAFITLMNGAAFNNKTGASFNINSDGQIANGAGANLFSNAGSTVKSGGAGGFNFNVPVSNSNTFGVTSGTMIVGNGGSMTAGAMTAGAAGTSIDFFGGTFTVTGGNFSGTSGAIKILGTGTLAINASATSTAPFSVQNGGTLDVAATRVLALDFLNWTGGTIQNTGQVRVTVGGTIGGGTFPMTLNNTLLTIEAPVNYDGDATNFLTLTGSANLMVTNGWSLSLRADGILAGVTPASLTLSNGTVMKTLGTGASRIDLPIATAATPNALGATSGTLHLKTGGGTLTNTSINTGTAQKVQFEGNYTINTGSNVGGTGTIELTTGAFVVVPNVIFPIYNQNGGALGGAGNVTVRGGQWLAGDIGTGGGTLTIDTGATFTIGNPGTKNLRRNTTNNGTVNLTNNTAILQFENGITFTNNGTLAFQSDAAIGCTCGTPSTLINNSTRNIVKSGGSAASNIAAIVNNDGLVQVSTSGLQLNFNNGGTHNGAFSGVAGGSIGFSGTHAFGATSSFSGSADILFGGTETISGSYALAGTATTMIYAGTATFNGGSGVSMPRLNLNGGTIDGTANITLVASGSQWTAGTIRGTGTFTVDTGATLAISGAAGPMVLDGRTLTNNGFLGYTSASNSLSLANTASIVNNSTFQTSVATPINAGAGSNTIVNNGLFARATAAGNLTVAPAFTNTNTVSLQAGTTTFNSFTQSAGATGLAGGHLASGTTVNINGGSVTGNGSISANLSNAGAILPGVGTTTGTITITGTYTQTGTGKLEIDIGGTTAGTQYDVLSATGQPALAGELKVNLINSFVPSNGQTFDILGYAVAPSTDFTTNTLPSFGVGGFFSKTYQPANLRLTAVVPSADVQITNVPSGPAKTGDTVTFTITVQNTDTTFTANSVTLSNSVSGPATLLTSSTTVGSCTGLNCTIGNLAPGASAVVTLTFTATAPGTIQVQASSSSTTPDPNGTNNTNVSANVVVSPKANVSVGVTDTPDPVNATANVTYTVTVTNAGPDPSASAAVALSVTNGSIVTATSGAFTCSGTGASASCTAASLAVTSATITVTVQSGPQGTTALTATYSSTTFDSNTADNSASQTTTITPQADLAIVKSGPTSATPGTLVYTVTVTNNGPSDATAVTVSDPTPAGTTFVSNSGDCTTAYPCSLGTVNAGQSKVITSTYSVPTNATGSITNTATVSSATTDPNGTNNSSTVVTPVNQTADLSIVKTGPASIVAGTQIVYTLTITNNGPSDATSVTVTDPAPAGLTFVSNSGACTTAFPCSIASISSGSTAVITSTFATSPSLTGSITNTAGVSSAIIDPNGANNSSSVATTVSQSADVEVVKTGPASATSGNVTYTITVRNNGPSNASGVTVNDPTPAGLTFVSNSGACTTAYPCNIGALAAGSTATITTTFNAGPSTTGSITNTATVTASTTDPNAANNSSSVTTAFNATADLSITKTGPASALAGTNITYTITVQNNGPSNATNVSVADPTPPGLTFAGTSGACSGSFPCTIASLASGATATINATYFVSASSGSVTNTATVSFAGDSNAANNSSSITTTIQESADLLVTKTGPATAATGSTVDYTITVRNNGPSTAAGAVLNDPTPAGATFVSAGGACTSFPCNLPALTAGQTIGVSARFTITAGSGSSVTNTASVTATTPDPNGANNSASATTTTDCITTVPTATSPANEATSVPLSGTLNWSGVSADFYSIYLGRADQNGCSTPFGSSETTSLSYSGLAPNTKYAWRIEAVTNNCPARASTCATFTTAANCNVTITLVKPLGGTLASPVEFEWLAVSGATEYALFAKSGNGNFLELGRTTSTKLTASVALDGTTQWYVVATVPGCGTVQSATASFNVCTRPGTPLASVVGETTSAKTYSVEWPEVPNAVRYEIDEAANPSFTGATTISTDKLSVAFRHDATDTPLAFYYRVRAFSACTPLPGDASPTIRIIIIPLPRPTEQNQNVNIPAGSTETVVQQVFIPGVPGVTAFYNAVADRPWLTVRPPSGVLPPEGITLEVVADPRTLPNGTFTATVIVTITTPSVSGIAGNATTTTSKPISISLVTPVTPVQNKIAPTNDALIIPSVGHLDGVNSHWQSDIRVTNTGIQSAQYALTFTPSAGSATGIKQTTITVGPGETTALDDIIKNWFGIGSLGDSANGMLEIRSADNKPLTAVASSRTYNVTANGTLGQFIPALPFSGFIGKAIATGAPTSLSMQQISQSSLYRTNVGIVEASGKPASVLMSVFNAAGSKLIDLPFELGGGEQRQLNSVLAANNITLSDGRVEVKVTGGDGKVTAYASVVDNATNDPLLVTGVATNATGASKYVLPGVADLTNALANWRTDMRIFNPSFASQNATLTLHPLGGGAPLNASVALQPGEVRTLDDVVKSLFKASNVGGAVHVQTASQANLVVTGRTYNQTSSGTFGQFIEAVTPDKAVGAGGRALHVLQVEDSTRYRTNLGIAEVTGQEAMVEVQIFLPDSKVTPTITFPLAANEFRQLSVIRDQNLGNVYNARLTVRVVGGQGKVTAYGSVVDMITQDPTYVPAQ